LRSDWADKLSSVVLTANPHPKKYNNFHGKFNPVYIKITYFERIISDPENPWPGHRLPFCWPDRFHVIR